MNPPYLKHLDKIALAAPARKIKRDEINHSISILNEWGLEVVIKEELFKTDNQFGGKDEERIELFQSFLDDEEIKAILCVRGGYGITRIIDHLDFNKFKDSPKWICGYSDITALLCHIHNFNIESIHSTMPLLFERDTKESVDSLRKLLFGEGYQIEAPPHALNCQGHATGKVIGGNLSILNTLIATMSDVDTTNTILFLEDIDEYLYNIDRMMVHLKRAGKLDLISGLIVGHMTDMKDNTVPFGSSAYEIIHHWVKEYSFPVAYGFPIGHEPNNMAIPFGRKATLLVHNNGSVLRF